ncbi:MAG: fructokinase [Gaiellaceae bacterium]|nr:fructokinase [Gaiellaceae bacterium]
MSTFGGIETGGSKWMCAVGTGPDDLPSTESFPTTTPEETIGRAIAFFEAAGPVDAIGIGSFGPVDLDPASPTWGYITSTPKPGWVNTNVARAIGERLSVPVGFDTDVNAAALGEHRWGAAQDVDTFCYITVGTGIGGGVMAGGKLVHGLIHPEFGHLRIPHDVEADPFPGSCPYHGDCWEGLASGTAVEARWGAPAAEIRDPAAWALEARYLALGLVAVISILSPQRIIIGGGVSHVPNILPQVQEEIVALMDGYLERTALVTLPALGSHAGVLGAIALAESVAQ